MKIEIDLNDILGDEYGAETIQEATRRQVIEKLTKLTQEKISKEIDKEISLMISTELKKSVELKMDEILILALDSTYKQVDRWGDRVTGETTLRKEIIKEIQEGMKISRNNYNDAQNPFTKMIDGINKDLVQGFKEQFDKSVVNELYANATKYAFERLNKQFSTNLKS
jgi:hypothetical protein